MGVRLLPDLRPKVLCLPPPPLPPGVWYEKQRERYRVRLYIKSKVVFRGYYRTREAAIRAYEEALRRKDEMRSTMERASGFFLDLDRFMEQEL